MLNKLRDALIELDGFSDSSVFYGVAKETDATKNVWNYIVFNRDVMKMNNNKTSFTFLYEVNIVQENYIQEGLIQDVINKMSDIGLRITDEPPEFSYVKKDDGTTVEILRLNFNYPRKRVSCYGSIQS